MSFICIWTREHYERTDSGKSWRNKPHDVEHLIISDDWQREKTSDEEARFWNVWGTCRRQYGYTYAGYRVTRMTMTNPDASAKTCENFRFVSIPTGYREDEILRAARTADVRTETVNGEPHEIARFSAFDRFIDIDVTAQRVVS